MTDTQIVTLALVFVAALGSIMFNNARITDLRSAMDSRFNDVNKRFDDVNRHIDDKFALLSQQYSMLSQQMTRMEENIMRILGDHETRLQKLEHPKSL